MANHQNTQTNGNDSETSGSADMKLTGQRSGPVRRSADARAPQFVLVDKDGNWRQVFYHATAAAEYAKQIWPDQEQDPECTETGWNIVVQP